jgi:YggT family protein
MLSQILQFLIDTVSGFFVILLLARFHFQWLRVPFRNQVGQFLLTITNWMVLPARRIVPSAGGFDLATLLLALLVQALTLWCVAALRGVMPDSGAALGGLLAVSAFDLLRYSIHILIFALIVQAVLSWTNPGSPMLGYFDVVVSPFLRPLRRFVPLVANFDLSPLVLLVILQVLLIPLAYARGMVAGAF